jgi:hypothetical protein
MILMIEHDLKVTTKQDFLYKKKQNVLTLILIKIFQKF